MLMVSSDPQDTPQTLEKFRQKGNVSPLSWAVDRNGEIARSLDVNALETTVIIDQEGDIVFKDTAATDYETLKRELEEVL